MQIHTIPPVYDENSRVLILGSFPSVKSREVQFFYGHPQNRFWRVLALVFGEEVPKSTEEKKSFLLEKGIALWDVIESCEIEGSSDSSVKNVSVNDIGKLLEKTRIEKVFLNGKCAERYYKKYFSKTIEMNYITLPSTSPANAAYSLERLAAEWAIVSQTLWKKQAPENK